MAARGAGPSRRSHTKSRKGCKTCKRRHIRCDESYPQCRNCTKHHVRCDYTESDAADPDSLTAPSSERASPISAASLDESLAWKPHGVEDSYTALGLTIPSEALVPTPAADAHLVHHINDMLASLESKDALSLPVWTADMSRHLTLCDQFPYVMHSVKAFAAAHLSWSSQSHAERELSIQHSGAALSGLHTAVGRFNKDNADAVFGASVLLASQCKDWLSWTSLVSGAKSISAAIAKWNQEFIWSDYVRYINHYNPGDVPEAGYELPLSMAERTPILQEALDAFEQLCPMLSNRPVEANWLSQFVDFTRRLAATESVADADSQFGHLYTLRKWIYWVPLNLLLDGEVDLIKLALVSHLYALGLTVCKVYKVMAREMIGGVIQGALPNVLTRMHGLQDPMGYFDTTQFAPVMRFPQAALNDYSAFYSSKAALSMQIPDISTFFSEDINTSLGNLSPAFTPAPFAFQAHSRASSTASAFLEVPTPINAYAQHGFSQNIEVWGAFPSPIFPSLDFSGSDDGYLFAGEDSDSSSSELTRSMTSEYGGGKGGGFMQACEIWT